MARRRAWPWAAALAAVGLATGCPAAPGPVKLEPTLIPPPFQAVSPGSVQQQGVAISGGTLTVKVVDTRTHARVAGAQVSVVGPTLATAQSGATYDLAFMPLAAGTYRVRVAAPGYVTGSVSQVTIAKQATTSVEADLTASGGPVTGTVMSAAGQPIAGARVVSGDAVALSGSDGGFQLDGLAAGSHTLTIAKTGFAPLTGVPAQADQAIGTQTLEPAPVVVDVANASSVYGAQSAASTISGLEGALRAASCQIQENSATGASVMLFAAPGADAIAQAGAVQSFVEGGGKLVVLGEWGGTGGGYDPDAVNALVQPMGLAIETDLVRNQSNLGKRGWIEATADLPMAGVSQVALFDSASVFKVAPGQDVLSAGSSAFRVADVDQNGPIMGAEIPYGTGLVVLLGDTSAFSDAATLGQGADLAQKDNQAFIVDSILW